MARRHVTVGSSIGLHAKSAGLVSAEVFDSGLEVTFSLPDSSEAERIDASSALLLMTLGADRGQTVVIECEDEQVLDRIAALVETDLTTSHVCRHRAPMSPVATPGT